MVGSVLSGIGAWPLFTTPSPLALGRSRRLPGKGSSNSHGARPVHHQINSMIKWIQTSTCSITNYLSSNGGIGPLWDRLLAPFHDNISIGHMPISYEFRPPPPLCEDSRSHVWRAVTSPSIGVAKHIEVPHCVTCPYPNYLVGCVPVGPRLKQDAHHQLAFREVRAPPLSGNRTLEFELFLKSQLVSCN